MIRTHTHISGNLIHEVQAETNTSENELEADFQPDENKSRKEPIATHERYSHLLIGEVLIAIDKTSEQENCFDEFINVHYAIPLTPEDECLTSVVETIKHDDYSAPTVEDKSENVS